MNQNVKVKVEHLTLELAPVSQAAKTYIKETLIQNYEYRDFEIAFLSIRALIRDSLKSISGLTDPTTQKPFLLEKSQDQLTEDCSLKLLLCLGQNRDIFQKIAYVIYEVMDRVPFQFTDKDGRPLDGVEILPDKNQLN